MSDQSEQVVRDFCAAWSRLDVEELLEWFTADAVYHNVPIDPVQGHDGIRGILEMFVPPAESIEFEMLNVASAGDVVFTERVDRFVIDGKTIELPVAGIFEVQDGKVAAWRDYFDLQTWMTQTS